MPRSVANLGKWLNEPVVQDAVAGALINGGQPMLMREIAEACDIPVRSANRALLRLHHRGSVTRYKLPMQRHAYCHRRKACIAGGATRLLYVYTWADGATQPR